MSKYINADRLKVTLLNFADRTKDMEDVGIGMGVHSCIHCLDDMPSADVVEVKHGEWIKVTNGRGGHECSLCGNYALNYQSGTECITDFCPFCGAGMRGTENDCNK